MNPRLSEKVLKKQKFYDMMEKRNLLSYEKFREDSFDMLLRDRCWLWGHPEGIVFHTNTMADLDLEAYDVVCAWLNEHGDEEVPDME